MRCLAGPLLLVTGTVCALVLVAMGCSSDDNTSLPPIENTVLPDDTIPAPGSCDPREEVIPPPQVVIDGARTDATLGSSDDSCSGLSGSGFVTFNYNPVLLDAAVDSSVTVVVEGGATATVSWADGEAFASSGASEFESAPTSRGCRRVIVRLVSASGDVTATYGADVRVGGDDVECDQRDLAPSEVPDSVVTTDSTGARPPATTAKPRTTTTTKPPATSPSTTDPTTTRPPATTAPTPATEPAPSTAAVSDAPPAR